MRYHMALTMRWSRAIVDTLHGVCLPVGGCVCVLKLLLSFSVAPHSLCTCTTMVLLELCKSEIIVHKEPILSKDQTQSSRRSRNLLLTM